MEAQCVTVCLVTKVHYSGRPQGGSYIREEHECVWMAVRSMLVRNDKDAAVV